MQDLWTEILGPNSDKWVHSFPDTIHRLASFNYDRVPEITFAQSGNPNYAAHDIYGAGLLNTGLSDLRGPYFDEQKFCYLKLHGTVGAEPFGKNEIQRDFGRSFGQYVRFQVGAPTLPVSDSTYFKEELDADGLPQWKRTPLIVFPAEKQRVEGGGTEYNFEDYVHAIRLQAQKTFAQAEKIRVIGYSFAVPDKEWLVSLLQSNPEARKLIINPHAKGICEDLEDDGIRNLVPRERRWGGR